MFKHFNTSSSHSFSASSTADDVSAGLDLSDKTYLITGVNSGLGLESARVLVQRGARIIGLARSKEKAEQALRSIHAQNSIGFACDLSEAKEVQATVESIQKQGLKIDSIIANAGIMALPKATVKYGIELQFLTNHIGHFILITGLLTSVTKDARIVVVASRAHKRSYREGIQFNNLDAQKEYRAWGAYGQSKLANILFAKALAKRLPAGQSVYSLHPGVINTNLMRHLPSPMRSLFSLGGPRWMKSIPQGAATQVYLAVHPNIPGQSGDYFSDCQSILPNHHGQNTVLAEELWRHTERLVEKLLSQ